MRVEYQISEQDFVDAQRLAIRNSPVRFVRWTRLVVPLFGAVLLVFLVQVIVQQGFTWRVVPAAIFPLIFLATPLLNKWNQRKMYAKTTNLHGQQSLAADDEGLSFLGPTFSSEIQWPHFHRFLEDERVFLLYQNPQVFNIIPKRELAPDEIEGLRMLLKQNVPLKR